MILIIIFKNEYRVYITNNFRDLKYNLLYLVSPDAFRLLYDKYYRTDLYNQVRSRTFSGTSKIDYKEFNNKVYNQKLIPKIDELIVINYYMNLGEYYLKMILALVGASVNSLFYFSMVRMKFEKRNFIFLDNNRLIYNKLNFGRVLVREGVKINSIWLFGATLYFLFQYSSKKYFVPVEIDQIGQTYNRDILLYQRVRSFSNEKTFLFKKVLKNILEILKNNLLSKII
jgi:hypothetical protein